MNPMMLEDPMSLPRITVKQCDYGWYARSYVRGHLVHTIKNWQGVIHCGAQEARAVGGGSFWPFGPTVTCAESRKRATKKQVRLVHTQGLNAFLALEPQQEEAQA